MKFFILLVVICAVNAWGQERLLVNPNNEVTPLKENSAAIQVIAQHVSTHFDSIDCNDNFNFGYTIDQYFSTRTIGSNHKDVLGMWFIAPAKGTIDTIFWYTSSIGIPDSTVTIRIFRSNIYPGKGPGYAPYPLPCIPWGYYISTNDSDQQVTPFRNEATDTTWISTIGDGLITFDPLGPSLWGGDTGHVVKLKSYSVNHMALSPIETLRVNRGDAFFITMRMNSPNRHPDIPEERTYILAWESDGPVSPGDESYPSRIWKFYEHDSGPSNCSNYPLYSVPKGWIARGPFTDDNMYTSAYNWWYSMKVESILPPIVDPMDTTWLSVYGDSISFCFEASFCKSDSITAYLLCEIDSAQYDTLDHHTVYPGNLTCFNIAKSSVGSNPCFRVLLSSEDGDTFLGEKHCVNVVGNNDRESTLPTRYFLYESYPNPFNPTTTIRYELPSVAHVQLKIFSLLGQEVVTLIDGIENTGYHEAEWDASAHAGGVYFIKFTAGTYIKFGKMLLIK